MKCPSCGNEDQQETISKSGYRCAACGRIYGRNSLTLDELAGIIKQAKEKVDSLTVEHERLACQIARVEEELKAMNRRNGQ